MFGGCVMEEDTVSETDQDLYVALPDQLWSPYQTIPLCFAYSSNDTTIPVNQRLAVTTFVKERVMATWGSVLPFNFTWRDCPATGSNYEVLVDLSWHDTGGTCFTTGTGLLRTSDQRPGDIANAWGCHIGIPPDWNASPDRLLHTQQIIIHEFGHLLGFSHEFKRPDAPGAPCSGTDAPGGVTLGDYDPDSIMLATYGCAGNPGRSWLSAGDVAGAQQLYGARAPRYANKDIAWQSTDGNVDIWRMDGTLRGSQYFVPTSIGSPYTLIGTGDFDGDGIGDLLYRQADGAVVIWLLNADGGIAAANLIPVPTDWVFQGVARFNSDNRSDVLWRNFNTGQLSTWMMDGVFIAYHREIAFSDWNWEIKLVGDFNGDGKADLFWRHRFGPAGVWLMNDGQPTYYGPTRDVDNTWTPKVAGDFDGDGYADVFWQNRDNRTSIWFMSGTERRYTGSPATIAPGWTAQIATDLDKDGKADLLWRRNDGSNGLWLMDGLSIKAMLPLPPADTSWSMRGALGGAFDPVH
ncbi:MAG: FG-GAP-like repeat-containing protein [Kofleriaceae bacterium]